MTTTKEKTGDADLVFDIAAFRRRPERSAKIEYSLHTLVPQSPKTARTIDIVAIHGLNGHFETTWCDERSGYNWLQEAIPTILPQARVMSFAYNSQLQFSTSTSNIVSFGDELLESLLLERRSEQEKQRRVVFICHSLGGLVFKQAIIRAHEVSRFSQLEQCIAGVVFFGTPHRGSDLASPATILGRLLSIASLGSKTSNLNLSKDLEPRSRMLMNLTRSFKDRAQELRILTFYELEKMDVIKSLVVDKDSCVLELETEIAIPLDRDHRSMCRFESAQDVMLRIVLSNIQEMSKSFQLKDQQSLDNSIQQKQVEAVAAGELKTLLAERQKEQLARLRYAKHQLEEQLVANLATSMPRMHKTRNPAAENGTCRWIFSHSQYQTWMENAFSSLLWLSANAGCGKSVLSSYLIDSHMGLTRNPGATICYFFFKGDDIEQHDAIHGLQAILHQLLEARPYLVTYLVDKFGKVKVDAIDGVRNHLINKCGDIKVDTVKRLWDMIVSCIEYPVSYCSDSGHCSASESHVDVFCVLDGLDECEPISRKQLLKLMSTYFTEHEKSSRTAQEEVKLRTEEKIVTTARQTLTSGSRFKVFISSRPDNDITIALDKQTKYAISRTLSLSGETVREDGTKFMLRLCGENEVEAINNDISIVINATITRLIDFGMPEDMLHGIQQDLIKRADRTFLWITLILRLLEEKLEAGASLRELKEIMKNRDIDSVYAELLSSRADAPKARKLLSILLASARAMTVEELSIAIAITPEVQTFTANSAPRRPAQYNFQDLEYDIVYPLETHIKALCGHFIRIIRGRVYFVHETAREFLLQSEAPFEELHRPTDHWLMFGPSLPEKLETKIDERLRLPWQYSFSPVNCHALLMEICVTYLYCIGKESKFNSVGEVSQKVGSFLDYASLNWTFHFTQIRADVMSAVSWKDLLYYHNLCHPQFPGFKLWTTGFWQPQSDQISAAHSTDLDIQNAYILFFRLDADDGAMEDPIVPIETAAMKSMSTNPSSVRTFSFPTKVSPEGYISLNFERKVAPDSCQHSIQFSKEKTDNLKHALANNSLLSQAIPKSLE